MNPLFKDLLSPSNLIKLSGLVITIFSAAWAFSGKLAVSQVELSDHGVRLEKIETDLAAKNVRDAKTDQKLDDVLDSVNEIQANVRDLTSRPIRR